MRAYHLVFPDQLSAPAWMDDAEFDVVANAPPGTTAEQLREMLQNLLADRFHMRVHHETRVLPVYELTVAKNGPKLKPAAPGSGTDDFVPGSRPRQVDRSGFPILPPGRTNVACWNVGTNVHCTYRVETMEALVQKLNMPTAASRHVIDKTGLTGRYDFTLYYRRADGPPPGSDNAPTIEQAVQEQLGVKLVPSKASVDVLVIDHAEKTPTQN